MVRTIAEIIAARIRSRHAPIIARDGAVSTRWRNEQDICVGYRIPFQRLIRESRDGLDESGNLDSRRGRDGARLRYGSGSSVQAIRLAGL